MNTTETNISTLELVSIQYEIAQSLNANMSLRALCRRYMETCLRRLSAKAIHLYLPLSNTDNTFSDSEIVYKSWGRISMPKVSASFPENVDEIRSSFAKLIKNYTPEQSEKLLLKQFTHNQTYYNTFTLSPLGVLIIEKENKPLPEQIINALAPAVKDLFNVCQLSIRHSQVLNEVERRKAAEEKLSYIAFHDELTGLPNRISLIKKLEQEISHCIKTQQEGMLVYVDLDYFRDINDSLGHVIGDKLLQQVASRLTNIIDEDETLFRVSSDEFIFLCPSHLNCQDRLSQLTIDINTCFSLVFPIENRDLEISASVGITHFSSSSKSAYSILMQSDLAMSKAKKNAGFSIELYQKDMERTALRRFLLDSDMRKGIAQNEFELVVQPQVNQLGEIISAETLIRWKHPELGMISPVEFINIAEKTGFIITLGEWIFEQACIYVKQLEEQNINKNLRLAINLSAKQFYQLNFVNRIKCIIDKHKVPASKIELELTESIMLENAELTIRKIKQLKRLGIEISIDDFGTGYSSLSYLKNLPIDRIKVDRSFVTNIDNLSDNTAIVEAIVLMANRFNLKLIAEGVENKSEVEYLTSIGCYEFQGFYFYKPMPFNDFLALVK